MFLPENPFCPPVGKREEIPEHLEVRQPPLHGKQWAAGNYNRWHDEICFGNAERALERAEKPDAFSRAERADENPQGEEGKYGKPVLHQELFLVRRAGVTDVKLDCKYKYGAKLDEFQKTRCARGKRRDQAKLHGKEYDGNNEENHHAGSKKRVP